MSFKHLNVTELKESGQTSSLIELEKKENSQQLECTKETFKEEADSKLNNNEKKFVHPLELSGNDDFVCITSVNNFELNQHTLAIAKDKLDVSKDSVEKAVLEEPTIELVDETEETIEEIVCTIPHITQFSNDNDTEQHLEDEQKNIRTEVLIESIQLGANQLDMQVYLNFKNMVASIKIQFEEILDEQAKQIWMKSIEQSEAQLLTYVAQLQPLLEEETVVRVQQQIAEFCKVELSKLQPIPFDEKDIEQKITSLTNAIEKYEQTEQQVIELTNLLKISKQQTENVLQTLEKRTNQSLEMMIKAVDLLDLIRNAAQNDEKNQPWIVQIDQATEQYLAQLKDFDAEEIQALGELLDGNYMVSLGTVPSGAIEGYIEKFQVCLVHERGFKKISTGEVIREAKVINVY